MKRTSQLIALTVILLSACTHPTYPEATPAPQPQGSTHAGRIIPLSLLPGRNDSFSKFISIDSANKMLQSYLSSIDYQKNDTELHAIIFKAADLRQMLSDGRISNVKIMLAHTLDYINAGGAGEYCGYKSRELTVIISGYDSSGNYVYTPSGKVLEMGAPCPTSCPATGSAASDLLY